MKYFDNQFLFSETYINKYINENNKKAASKDENLIYLFTTIVDWNKEYTIGDCKDELWVGYIDEILGVLGFQNKDVKENVRVLYTNPLASCEKPVAICYGIDKEEDVDSTIKGKYYAYNAVKAAKENDVEWAILTNGYKWRIYNTKNVSPFEFYLEIDIEASIKENSYPNEAFQLFNLFFNISTYYTEDGQLKIEKIKDDSDKTAETIEGFLRGKSEEILKDLCYGLKEDMNKQVYSDEDRKNIYNDAIILLYRLLFFGYAESRGLLPITNDDPNYTESFEKLCFDAKEVMNLGQLPSMKDGFEFWERLDSHLRVYVDNSYNGGLFHNDDKSVLREHRIANQHLVKCLAEISYNKDKNEKYTSKIYYKDLSVRNLGAIYEGLLEYRLFIAEEIMVQRKNKNKISYIKASETTLKTSDLKNIIEIGGIYLSQDAMERKETGAYYTPEDVVEYIVENTVGKKISELRQVLKDTLKSYHEELQYEPTDQGKRTIQNNIDTVSFKFINEKVLTLSIIDSAMGSGHFLVNAAYRVANEIVSILSNNEWESLDEISVDIKEWKRKVVENCIYGIDINELSVALARLSLWLISASNDKALSFIDHHLKTGDSIIGATKSQVKHVSDEKLIKMFDILPDAMLEPVIIKFNRIKEIGSSTKYDVEMQKAVYKQIEEELNLIKTKFDYYLATKYACGIEDEEKFIDIMKFGTVDDFESAEIKPLIRYAKENKFFHWELEFPQVFAKGGFDVIIGNPPYVEVNDSEYRQKYLPMNYKTKSCGNLYVYFIESGTEKLNKYGTMSMITPLAIFCTPRMEPAQTFIKHNYNKINISFYDCRPGTIFKNALVFASIFIFSNTNIEDEQGIYTTQLIKWYSHERKELFENIQYTKIMEDSVISKYSIPKFSNISENSIIKKLSEKKKKLSYFVDEKSINRILYGYGGRNWIKVMDFFPEFKKNGEVYKSTGDRYLSFRKDLDTKIIVSILNSTLFYWNYLLYSDCRNKTKTAMVDFYIDFDSMSKEVSERLKELGTKLMEDYKRNAIFKTCKYTTGTVEYFEFYPKKSKSIIDKIDRVLGEYYRLTEEEIEFIINYNIKFRLGEEGEIEDEL